MSTQYELFRERLTGRLAITASAGFPTATMTATVLKRGGSPPDDETLPWWRDWDLLKALKAASAAGGLLLVLIKICQTLGLLRERLPARRIEARLQEAA